MLLKTDESLTENLKQRPDFFAFPLKLRVAPLRYGNNHLIQFRTNPGPMRNSYNHKLDVGGSISKWPMRPEDHSQSRHIRNGITPVGFGSMAGPDCSGAVLGVISNVGDKRTVVFPMLINSTEITGHGLKAWGTDEDI